MAGKKKAAKKSTRRTEVVTREEQRSEFAILTNREIPPIVAESKYPWGELAEAHEEDPDSLHSFFLTCNNSDEAEKKRGSVQASGRNYYSKRRMPYSTVSRVSRQGSDVGIESWIVPIGDDS